MTVANSPVIDSHCHLDYPPLCDALDEVVARAEGAGVAAMISISTSVERFPALRALIDPYPNVGCTVGTHPHRAGEESVTTEQLLEIAAKDTRVVGIGESGLDYHYDHAPIEDQRRSFLRHIKACQQSGLPLVIHSRDADEPMADVLRSTYKEAPFSAVLHCFSGGEALAKCALELGMWISAPGIITFKNAQSLRDVFAMVPLNRLLVETDAPYLAPVPYRGKPNEPSYVIETARALADLHGVSYEEMAAQTRANTLRLFPRLRECGAVE